MSHGVKPPWRAIAGFPHGPQLINVIGPNFISGAASRVGTQSELSRKWKNEFRWMSTFGLHLMAGTLARDNFTHMKLKKLMIIKNKMLIGSALLMLAARPALATDDTNGESLDLYPANQLSLDAFGTISEGEHTLNHISGESVKNGARGGVGAGVTYFITRYIGIGADGYSENTSGPFIDNLSGNLYLRVPLGQSGFAPYIYGGGGYQFDSLKAGFGQAGAGMEFRFTPHIGLFADARYVLPDKTSFFGVGRAGLRIAF
jgi:hypothetical protein